MKKEDLIKSIIVFQCYLETEQKNPDIKKALGEYNKLFSDVIKENRTQYFMYRMLMNQEKETKQ